jgi:hypothetical protein
LWLLVVQVPPYPPRGVVPLESIHCGWALKLSSESRGTSP